MKRFWSSTVRQGWVSTEATWIGGPRLRSLFDACHQAVRCRRGRSDLLRGRGGQENWQCTNFGLPTRFGGDVAPWGINGKISEAHAAVGLAVLDTLDKRLARRRGLAARYMARWTGVDWIQYPRDRERSTWQVFSLLMPTARAASALVESACHLGMEVRRYYRPSLTHWMEPTSCPTSDSWPTG